MSAISIAEFADKIDEVMPLMVKEFARRQVGGLYKIKVSLPQFFILQILHKEGELKMSQLALFMNVTTSAMTGIVDRLVRDGFAVRVYDPKDRRIIKVRLTVKGNESIKKISEQRRRLLIRVFSKFSERDRQDYLRLLMQIKDILSKEQPNIK